MQLGLLLIVLGLIIAVFFSAFLGLLFVLVGLVVWLGPGIRARY